jgi:hypothetical protein
MTRSFNRGSGRSEAQIMADIRLALGRIPDLALLRNSVGVATEFDPKTHQTRTIRYGLGVGSADLVGCLAGRFVGLEVKTPDGRLTPEQERWAAMIRGKGGFVATVRDEAEALGAIEGARRW